ncbi:MAG: cytochrome c-type biogenesis CcmF C-terminal domain-containing protein, partial [Acidobacteriota bacterium]
LNNILLVTFTFTVLIGTLFPIIAEAVRGVKVSVGEPYFNRMAVPICLGLLLLMGIGPALPWGRASAQQLKKALLIPIPAALAGLGLTLVLGGRNPSVLLTGALAGYALWVTIDQAWRPARARSRKGESIPTAVDRSAIAISSNYQLELETALAPGQSAELGSYRLTFNGSQLVQEPHLTAQQATISVSRAGKSESILRPSLNFYPTQREPIGTPAIKSTLTHDLYLTVMNISEDGRLGLRAIVTPAVVWIWIGVLVMVVGTALCLVPPQPVQAAESVGAAESVA